MQEELDELLGGNAARIGKSRSRAVPPVRIELKGAST